MSLIRLQLLTWGVLFLFGTIIAYGCRLQGLFHITHMTLESKVKDIELICHEACTCKTNSFQVLTEGVQIWHNDSFWGVNLIQE